MKIKIILLSLLLSTSVFPQAKKADTLAIIALDRMSNIIGDLQSCSYNLSVAVDKPSAYGLEKHFHEHEVYMSGPDKMLVQSKGTGFHKGFWYNGKHVVYYSYNENNYSVIPAPNTIVSTIDSIHANYDFDFPAADFFYPAFTDDILEDFTTVAFLGNKKVEGKDCFHILADNSKLSVQIWISDDALTLPIKFIIQYKDKQYSPQYEATFTNWQLNPVLPDVLFEFTPPPAARQISIQSNKVTP